MRISLCVLALSAAAAWAQSGLTYSTYLREGFTPAALATDAAGNLYLAGSTIVNAASSQTAAAILKLAPGGASYVYSRTFGGSASDVAFAVAVDTAGDAYVVGTASSPDFPITPGQQTGTLPVSGTRAFLAKFDPQGELVFSEVLGAVNTEGLAVALAPDGGIIVSGFALASGLAATPGAYSVPDTNGRPYLMKVDATGAYIVFTATGIGGNALAVDAAGNIYMAGAAHYYYPTTPGAYQTFPDPASCPECFFADGANQYVTKVDPAATTLLYSTGVASDSLTLNKGLAVDASGNAYVTGVANGSYSWDGTQPNSQLVEPLLTKLDAAGAHALYSISVGGAGIALGTQGDLYVGGSYNDVNLGFIPPVLTPPLPAGISNLPAWCQTNDLTTFSEAYVSHVDAATGNILGTVLVDGSDLSAAGIAYAGGSSVWLAGPTSQADTPITPGALAPNGGVYLTGVHAGVQLGSYLGEADFTQGQSAGPQVACVTDNATEARVGVVAPNQLLTLYGSGLGPKVGVAAPNYSTTSLAGVTVTFNDELANLLYVSSTQINVAVPADEPIENSEGGQNLATMQVKVNGTATPERALPIVASNPSLFGDLSGVFSSCTVGEITYTSAYLDLAINADGSVNSCAHPAQAGSTVSLFLNGLGIDTNFGEIKPWTPATIPLSVAIGPWSAEVVNISALNTFMWQIDARIPVAAAPATGQAGAAVTMFLSTSNGLVPVGPLSAGSYYPFYTAQGTPLPLSIWVSASAQTTSILGGARPDR